MKRITIIITTLLLIVAVYIYKFPYQPKFITDKQCNDTKNPCYKITMINQPDLFINSWQRYGDSNCINFTSLPDSNFHGYCGNYKIEKLRRFIY